MEREIPDLIKALYLVFNQKKFHVLDFLVDVEDEGTIFYALSLGPSFIRHGQPVPWVWDLDLSGLTQFYKKYRVIPPAIPFNQIKN